ncbi:MAG: YkgJ family cysteine cluster protein [Treponema sp.]|jgi:Fe-S-cluster containining protein|nr:YkgJ family cysteine cluster protein [Treponema sp.]
MERLPFYAAGLRFSCTRCSACCRYESGYVFLSREDLDILAVALDMARGDFIKTWCRWVPLGGETEYLSLKEKINKDCVFWKDGCTVYRDRPSQCRTFPFWDSIVGSAAAWESAGRECPGLGHGELRGMAYIKECLRVRASRPPLTRKPERPNL